MSVSRQSKNYLLRSVYISPKVDYALRGEAFRQNVSVDELMRSIVESALAKDRAKRRPRLQHRSDALLSDPDVRKATQKQLDKLTSSKSSALKYLQELGIATSTGRLKKRHGG